MGTGRRVVPQMQIRAARRHILSSQIGGTGTGRPVLGGRWVLIVTIELNLRHE